MPAKVMSNLESIGDMIGALAGMSEGLDDQLYLEGLIKSAHGKAATAFDVAAAATAKTGRFNHVYEFGTAGVTRGATRFADPTSEGARLYVHHLTGHGGEQDIGYTFRPALQPNPTPTPENTGVDEKYLSKLSNRKYYFWNKAYVMETGMPVTIKPQNGNFLFVPFYGRPSPNPMYNRGHIMWNASKLGPLHARPGRSSKGEFTQFWMGWWSAMGSEIIQREMEKNVTMDIELAMAEAMKSSQSETLKSITQTNVAGASAKAKALFSKIFKAKSAKRREKVTK